MKWWEAWLILLAIGVVGWLVVVWFVLMPWTHP